MHEHRTERARVSGLGSARSGTGHFWEQRISAIALAFLAPFFVYSFAHALGSDYATVRAIYSQPFNAIVALGFVLVACLHLVQGLAVIIEDYVHGRAGIVWLIAMRLLVGFVALTGAFAILKIAFSA